MSTIDASELLRPGLLEGVSILLAGAPASGAHADVSFADAVREACGGLGARVCACELGFDAPDGQEEGAVEGAARDAVERTLADGGSIELLVVDSASVFARARGGEHAAADDNRRGDPREALRACLDLSWNVTRAVANDAFLPDGRGGRIVYLGAACRRWRARGRGARRPREPRADALDRVGAAWGHHCGDRAGCGDGGRGGRADRLPRLACRCVLLGVPAGSQGCCRGVKWANSESPQRRAVADRGASAGQLVELVRRLGKRCRRLTAKRWCKAAPLDGDRGQGPGPGGRRAPQKRSRWRPAERNVADARPLVRRVPDRRWVVINERPPALLNADPATREALLTWARDEWGHLGVPNASSHDPGECARLLALTPDGNVSASDAEISSSAVHP